MAIQIPIIAGIAGRALFKSLSRKLPVKPRKVLSAGKEEAKVKAQQRKSMETMQHGKQAKTNQSRGASGNTRTRMASKRSTSPGARSATAAATKRKLQAVTRARRKDAKK